MAAAAARPHVDITKPQVAIGTNTVACMQSGIYRGYVGWWKGSCGIFCIERDRPMKVIGTGGWLRSLSKARCF